MQCIFCAESLNILEGHSGKGVFTVYQHLNCVPNHDSIYRQLYFDNQFILLSDNIQILGYYITRHFYKTTTDGKSNYTIICKESNNINLQICELDGILDLPFHNIAELKKKLAIYTLFS